MMLKVGDRVRLAADNERQYPIHFLDWRNFEGVIIGFFNAESPDAKVPLLPTNDWLREEYSPIAYVSVSPFISGVPTPSIDLRIIE